MSWVVSLMTFLVGTLGCRGASVNPGMNTLGVQHVFTSASICLDRNNTICTETNTTEIIEVSPVSEHRQYLVNTMDFRKGSRSYIRTKRNRTTEIQNGRLRTYTLRWSEVCRVSEFPSCTRLIRQWLRTIHLDDITDDRQLFRRTRLVCTVEKCTQTTTVSHSSCDPGDNCRSKTSSTKDICMGGHQCDNYTKSFVHTIETDPPDGGGVPPRIQTNPTL